jgi:hypothetical protein
MRDFANGQPLICPRCKLHPNGSFWVYAGRLRCRSGARFLEPGGFGFEDDPVGLGELRQTLGLGLNADIRERSSGHLPFNGRIRATLIVLPPLPVDFLNSTVSDSPGGNNLFQVLKCHGLFIFVYFAYFAV